MQLAPERLPAHLISIIKPLAKKDLSRMKLKKLDSAVTSAFEIGFVFNVYTLGEECLQRLGFKPEQYFNFEWSLLDALGFTEEEIEAD